jgi:hypothetical protein
VENAKRLKPTPETLRELFLKSGNLCAFPGCNQLMMGIEGDFIGQLCHIEAAAGSGDAHSTRVILEREWPMTIRQIFYRLVSRA